MFFKISPGWITPDGQKAPLEKGWQSSATQDPVQIQQWQQQYRERLSHWVVPCGMVNDLLVLDIDVKNGGIQNFTNLGFQIPYTLYQRTLNGGFHYFFRYPKDGKKYGNKIGVRFPQLNLPKGVSSGIDTRGEGGYVFWYGHEADTNAPIAEAPQWLLDFYTAKQENSGPLASGSNVRLSPEIAKSKFETAIAEIRNAASGESNNVLNVSSYLVGQLIASEAVSYEYAYQELYAAGIQRKGAEKSYEVQETVKSGLQGGMNHPLTIALPPEPPPFAFELPPPPEQEIKERWTPKYFTRADLRDKSKLRQPQLFENWSTQDILLTTADGGTGKTTLKLFEAVMGALGERFLGFENKRPGFKTLFITGEDTAAKLGAMLGMMLEQLGLFDPGFGNEEKIERVLQSILIKKDSDLCLIEKSRGGFLIPSANAFNKVLEAIEDFKPDLVVFDPIASFWGSESALNDMAKAVTTFMSRLSERGVAVEMINHMGKSSSQSKDATQFAGRGGTGLPSHSRVSRVLHPVNDEEFYNYTGEQIEDGTSAIICTVNKFTDGSPLYNKPFLIMRKGYLFTRKDLSPVKQVEEMNRRTDAERIFSFIKETRNAGKYPTVKYTVAWFKTQTGTDKISEARVKEALQVLAIDGHMGEKVIPTTHPDGTITEKVLIVTDMDGREG